MIEKSERGPRGVVGNYAEFLQQKASEHGITNSRELAEFIGIARGTVNNILNGKPIYPRTRNAIAMAFGLTDEESTTLGSGIPLGSALDPEKLSEARQLSMQMSFQQKLGAALLERVANGPPINELEEKLLRDLGGLVGGSTVEVKLAETKPQD